MAPLKSWSPQLRHTVASRQARMVALTWAPWVGSRLVIRVWLRLITESHMFIPTLHKHTLLTSKTCTIRINPYAGLRARNQIMTHVNSRRCGPRNLFSKQYPYQYFLCQNLYSSCTLQWAQAFIVEGLIPCSFASISLIVASEKLRTEKVVEWSACF